MFGLFDWIWDLLYGISKSMYSIIDNLMSVANMLCGIEPIRYHGTEMDFLTFLFRNQAITYAFTAAVIIGVALVVIFAVIMIIRTIGSEKIEKTPAQIAVQVGKTMLIFLFIPAAMVLLIFFTNKIMLVLYNATLGGSPDGLGRFLAGAFGQNALKGGVPTDFYLSPAFDYTSTSNVKGYLHLDDYDFFFSWISCLVIILALGMTLLMFVDRAISLVILFVVSPISLSTSVLDDGARFKLWRDQFIVKFLTGYGCIIAINIYALIVGAITQDGLVFFDNKFLNNFMKIVIIVGGGVSLQRVMALVGNLISAGAGSNELRDSAIASGGFRRAAFGAVGGAFSATRGAWNFARDTKNLGFKTALGRAMGFKTSRDYNLEKARLNAGGLGGSSGTGNNKPAKENGAGKSGGAVKNVISGGANPAGEGGKGGGKMIEMADLGGSNANNNNIKNGGNNMVNDSVNNALHNNKNDKNKKD